MVKIFMLFLFFLASNAKDFIEPPANLPSAPYPEWAHYHWVWLSARSANQTLVVQLVNDYLARDIPVGAVNIDSSWQTGYNSLAWNTKLYPNASNMIDYFHSLGIRVIAWATSVVDIDSPNYTEGKSAGYFLNDGATIKWWHGTGSFVDYSNPKAVAWWHGQMDVSIDMGIDGWKCDGTDPYIFELGVAIGHSGIISEREYANAYYRDFFYYTQSQNPEALIMARPVNDFWSFAPHDVMFSGWVGDQDPTFEGLTYALTDIFYSAWRNYLNFGSDTGGYREGNDPPLGRTKELFIRWAQANSFLPLFENGGENEHRPWMFDNTNDTLNTYRYFVTNHMDLVPYFLAAGTEAYAKNISVITPTTPPNGIIASFEWMLWTDIFVAAITENSTTRQLTFPTGNNWVDWWTNKTYTGGSEVVLDVPLEKFPVFKRMGSIIPLQVTTDYSSHGDHSSSDALTILLQHPASHDEDHAERKLVYEFGGSGLVLGYNFSKSEQKLTFRASAHKSRPLLLLVRGVGGNLRVVVTGTKSVDFKEISAQGVVECRRLLREAAQGWCRGDGVLGELWVRPGDGSLGLMVEIFNVLGK